MVWICQKELDQGSSAPDKPEGHTLELTSAHAIRLRTDEDKVTEAQNTLGSSPRSGAKAFPRSAYPSAHHPAQNPQAPVPLPDRARAEGTSLHSPGLPPPRPPSTSST